MTILAAFLGAGLVVAQDDGALPVPVADREAVRPAAVVELRAGGSVEGAVALRDGMVVVTPEGGEAVTAGFDEIARLTVRLPATAPLMRDAETLLAGALPSPWRSRDLGRMVMPGKARWQDGQFILSASPRGDGERFDAMHMAYLPMKGDGEIVARVVKIDNEDEDSFGGIIMCDGLTPENRKAMLSVHLHGEPRVNFRRWGYQGGSSTGDEDPAIRAPYWLKLVREAGDVKAYYSPDGRRWRFLKEAEKSMRDEQIYVGLVARIARFDRLSEVIIDNVSINGEGSKLAEPMLPHLVLRSGSRLAADVVKGDRTAFHFRGRWENLAVTTPQVARVEFFHPLPEDLTQLVQGERTGLLLRSGDFSEGAFQSLDDGKVRIDSVLFGANEYSVLDEADALVLREVATPAAAPAFRLETQAGSILLADRAALADEKLVVEVSALGELHFGVEEIALLVRVGAQ